MFPVILANIRQPDQNMELALKAATVDERRLLFSPSTTRRLFLVTEAVRLGDSDQLRSRWADFVAEAAANGAAIDPNALVQYVLRESYLQTTEDLRFYAEKVRYFNEAKKLLRDYLNKLREFEQSMKDEKLKAEVAEHIKSLEEKLSSADDDAQLANVDLQNVLQKQQQTLQMMSNISKSLYDCAQAIIRKIGG